MYAVALGEAVIRAHRPPRSRAILTRAVEPALARLGVPHPAGWGLQLKATVPAARPFPGGGGLQRGTRDAGREPDLRSSQGRAQGGPPLGGERAGRSRPTHPLGRQRARDARRGGPGRRVRRVDVHRLLRISKELGPRVSLLCLVAPRAGAESPRRTDVVG